MLTETMTHAEVYRELDRDRDTATTWWRHHLDTLRRPVLKARQLPVIHWADYTSPARRIRYLFFTRIFDRHMRRLLTGVAVPHRTPEGTAVYTSWLSDQRLIAPMVILPHAWRRYRERTGCDLTGTDLIRRFFSQNPHGCDIEGRHRQSAEAEEQEIIAIERDCLTRLRTMFPDVPFPEHPNRRRGRYAQRLSDVRL